MEKPKAYTLGATLVSSMIEQRNDKHVVHSCRCEVMQTEILRGNGQMFSQVEELRAMFIA